MKEELEIKHIYGYLRYGLDAWIDGVICEIEGIDFHFENTIIAERVNYKLSEIVPILRPLSDLKKDEYFDLYMDLCEDMESVSCEYLVESLINKTKYAFNLRQLEKLEEFMDKYHFDWKYNLIERGLAVDINTLKK